MNNYLISMEESATNPSEHLLLKPGTLWAKTIEQTEFARNCGALKSIETEYHFIEQNNISFVVRTLSNLARKEKARQKQDKQEATLGKVIDPFLPYELDLFVGNISPTHLCLLNKFHVVENHLLIVTRAFEEQTDLLNLQDFVALWSCLQEIDGLAFFNGGKRAGASQRHKHLQLVPIPFAPNTINLPIESAIASVTFNNSLGTISSFPFLHAIAFFDLKQTDTAINASYTMLNTYHALLSTVGLNIEQNSQKQPGAYNFLATRNWMLIVPRSQESFKNISINSLGFAGSLFVRDPIALDLLKELTPMTILQNVAFAN
jgi:sulfate adenylyltransferase (ADP) / ATP adenylyltransferase